MKKSEIIIDLEQNMGMVIEKLNRFFIVLDRNIRWKNSNNDKIIKKLTLLVNVNKEGNKNFFNEFFSLVEEDTKDNDQDMQYPLLASRKNILPVIGTKETENIYNKGFVMGLKISGSNYHFEYRVDYDPIKKLHINLGLMIKNDAYFYALKIQPESKHYAVSETHNSVATRDELIKFKFFVKSSLAYFIHRRKYKEPTGILINSDTTIANFIQGNKFNSPSFANQINAYLGKSPREEELYKMLLKAKDSGVIVDLLTNHMELRHAFVEAAVAEYSKYKLSFSETNLDSEKEPKLLILSDEDPKFKTQNKSKTKTSTEALIETKKSQTKQKQRKDKYLSQTSDQNTHTSKPFSWR